tara:strand:- start:141 stop:767 length:627 start_codon:yes stop_codon:yes gene_type:complete
MFEVLYSANYPRGTWAGSLVAVDLDNKHHKEQRWEGKAKIGARMRNFDSDVYLGHCQAPTGDSRKWGIECTHPFIYEEWQVSHNGVITNVDELLSKYECDIKLEVDSDLIPLLLSAFSLTFATPEESITEALTLLKGTFAVWIYNSKTCDIYLARQGSTLFADKNGNFSSINSKSEWEEVEEGKLFKLTKDGLEEVGTFKNDTPFFTL